MKLDVKDPPRRFRVGADGAITMSDCAEVRLDADEQVTFVTGSGKRYDVAAKAWGFYATPSVNGRLAGEGFRTALVRNREGRCYVMLVEREQMAAFESYLRAEANEVLEWLDER